jgi:hypothetical protein
MKSKCSQIERVFTNRKDSHWESASWRPIDKRCDAKSEITGLLMFARIPVSNIARS